MYIIIALLLIPLIIILVLIMFVGALAYNKVMRLWYALTGRKPSNSGFSFRSYRFGDSADGFSNSTDHFSDRTDNRSQQRTSAGGTGSANGKKIFSKDDGEYVDFEVVE